MEIIKVNDDLDRFLDLAKTIYKDDPVWCKESKEYIEGMLGYMKMKGTHVDLLIVRDDEDLARASISLESGSEIGSIGHFEAKKNNPEAVKFLLDHIQGILKDKGAKKIIAPKSDIMSVGLQIHGFDLPQTWRTPHNPPYYQQYFESNDFQKKEDLLCYIMDRETPMEMFEGSAEVDIRPLNSDDLENEIKTFNYLNNTIFSSHDNFSPRTLEEDMIIVGSMLPFMDEDLLLFAEKDGGPVGFLICVPDHNQKLKEKRITRARLISIGILPEHTRQGIGKKLGNVLKKTLVEKGYEELEGSWVLESNVAPQNGADLIGAMKGRIFRLYTKDIL